MLGKVVDASVIAAITFNEPRSNEAVSLLEGGELFAPYLLTYELASIARKKILLYPEKRSLILQALEISQTITIQWIEVDPIKVVEFALEKNITTYDATYLYIAKDLNLELVTFDAKLKSVVIS